MVLTFERRVQNLPPQTPGLSLPVCKQDLLVSCLAQFCIQFLRSQNPDQRPSHSSKFSFRPVPCTA